MKTLLNFKLISKKLFHSFLVIGLVAGLTSCGKNNHLETESPNGQYYNGGNSAPFTNGGHMNPNNGNVISEGHQQIVAFTQGSITDRGSNVYTAKTDNNSELKVQYYYDNHSRIVGKTIEARLNFSNLNYYQTNNPVNGNPMNQANITVTGQDYKEFGKIDARSQVVATLYLRYSNNVTLAFRFHSY
jgi:hypothetical protein